MQNIRGQPKEKKPTSIPVLIGSQRVFAFLNIYSITLLFIKNLLAI